MKICVLITDFLPDTIGGAEVSVYNSSKVLAERGHDVHVITRKNNSPDYEIMDGIHVHRLPFDKKGQYTFEMVKFFFRVAMILRKIQPDVFHVHYINMNGTPGVFLGKLFRVPVVVTDHSGIYMKSRLYCRTFGRFAIKYSTVMVALTADLRRVFREIFPKKDIAVIGNGFDMDRFRERLHEQGELRRALEFEQDGTYFLYVGRIIDRKRIDLILKATEIAIHEKHDIRVHIIGKGPELDTLNTLMLELGIDGHVNFHGFKEDDIVTNYFLASDVYILTSDYEGLPVVLMEAYGAGLSIIISDFQGGNEIVTDGENGFIVPKDPSKIAEKMLILAGNKQLREEMRRNNLARSRQFTYDAMVDKLEKVYERIAH